MTSKTTSQTTKTYNLRRAEKADVGRLADIFFSAFSENAMKNYAFPKEPPAAQAIAQAYWTDIIAQGVATEGYHVVLVEQVESVESVESAQAIAFAIWVEHVDHDGSRPLTSEIFTRDRVSADAFPDASLGGHPAFAADFFNSLADQHARFMTDAATNAPLNHWFLALISTHRDFQGCGAGGRLLRYGESRADAAGVPCYLDATPHGRGVYESPKHGFRCVDKRAYALGDTPYEEVFMIRDPRPESS